MIGQNTGLSDKWLIFKETETLFVLKHLKHIKLLHIIVNNLTHKNTQQVIAIYLFQNQTFIKYNVFIC